MGVLEKIRPIESHTKVSGAVTNSVYHAGYCFAGKKDFMQHLLKGGGVRTRAVHVVPQHMQGVQHGWLVRMLAALLFKGQKENAMPQCSRMATFDGVHYRALPQV